MAVDSEPQESLLEALQDAGAVFPDEVQAGEIIDAYVATEGDRRGAETLAMIFSRLPNGRRGVELRAALLGTIGLSSEARRLGIPRQNLFRAVSRLKTRLFHKNG
jgi:hypothetical protein